MNYTFHLGYLSLAANLKRLSISSIALSNSKAVFVRSLFISKIYHKPPATKERKHEIA
jgi:hypothetical protein